MPETLLEETCNSSSLTHFYWCSVQLDLQAVLTLCTLLKATKSISFLSLYSAKIGDEGCVELAHSLEVTNTQSLALVHLRLSLGGSEEKTKKSRHSERFLIRSHFFFSPSVCFFFADFLFTMPI